MPGSTQYLSDDDLAAMATFLKFPSTLAMARNRGVTMANTNNLVQVVLYGGNRTRNRQAE